MSDNLNKKPGGKKRPIKIGDRPLQENSMEIPPKKPPGKTGYPN
jgi:hypothetical protein